MLFLTELLGLKVYDLKRKALGRIKDAALVPLIDPHRIDRYLIGGDRAWFTIRHDQVQSIDLEGIFLRDEQLTPYHNDEYMLRMARDLLDQQIIDAQGHKVVRVTDVTFEIRSENNHTALRILEVDVGIRSMVRQILKGVLPPRLIRRLQAPISPHSIRWEFCNIVEPDPQRRLRLNISNQALAKMHPADLADIMEDLAPAERGAIFAALDSETAADALSEVDPKMQASILESMEADKAADIVEEMAPDEAADALAELEEEASEAILKEMDSEPKTEVRELLEFEEDTAGGMMTTEFLSLPENATVNDAAAALKGNEELLEVLNTIFLVDAGEKLVGAVPVARLFLADGTTPVGGLRFETLIKVPASEKQDRVTELFDKYNLLTLPVVDDEGKLAGVITADDIISVLRQK